MANTFIFHFCCKSTQAILKPGEFEEVDWIIEVGSKKKKIKSWQCLSPLQGVTVV